MLRLLEEEYKFYLQEYNQFLHHNISQNHLKLATDISYKSDICQIIKYPSLSINADQIFLIATSIFNSPEIFFINQQHNLISNLQKLGTIYLVNWLESTNQMHLEDYAVELSDVINFLQINHQQQSIHIIGHCIGGIIAIGAVLNVKKEISSLTLLTMPWDFSHFQNNILWYKALALDLPIRHYEFIPKIYLQMMFFMLFPEQFGRKITKYFALDSKEEKEQYMQIENWLQSGHDISSSIYHEIIDNLIIKNILHRNEWRIQDKTINLSEIDCPTCIVAAKKDKIAPLNSMNYLQNSIKNLKLIEVEGGHINYLIKDDHDFHNQLLNWLFKESK